MNAKVAATYVSVESWTHGDAFGCIYCICLDRRCFTGVLYMLSNLKTFDSNEECLGGSTIDGKQRDELGICCTLSGLVECFWKKVCWNVGTK